MALAVRHSMKPLWRTAKRYAGHGRCTNIEALPAFRDWARTRGLPLYRRWGFWHDDVTLKLVSVHPLARILRVPELRARALYGPSIEAAFVAHAMDRITNARSLSRDIGVSYAAAHAAVERLVGRGEAHGIVVLAVFHGAPQQTVSCETVVRLPTQAQQAESRPTIAISRDSTTVIAPNRVLTATS
jgi:hypothetical protein